jgi:CubicO group peptidase (beta-lactamase class C family)
MFPTAEMQKNMAYLHQRDPTTGAITQRPHIFRRSCVQTTKEQQQRFFHSGGGGLWSNLSQYVKVLGMLLNDGVGHATGNRVLKKETVDLMWENQIPEQYVLILQPPPTF